LHPRQGIGSPERPEQEEQAKGSTLRGVFQGGENDRHRNLRTVGDFQGDLLQVFAESRASGKTKALWEQKMISASV